ncbi:ribulose-phosphate 3-epimerase [Aeoliella mucimassa]|uniref:Ribulose-phosphate 3-epimerase n=1 Tax=Aeoliella mucimassa TaxID=2527972 RepID=A0A518AH65_9BACT|nr:ribulose-phosphate 3-epimerase [Aeoliella mucimassa]QDU54067.1 Ribulose-phosphate 3-epimerase [Aeoliella mucimassa]
MGRDKTSLTFANQHLVCLWADDRRFAALACSFLLPEILLLVTALNHREQIKSQLRSAAPAIAPSILLCDYAKLGQEIADLQAAGAQLMHLDVMDGHFVPNFTFGMTIVEAARRSTDLPLDVHLMMENPGRYLKQFREAGADVLTVHEEVCRDQQELADLVAEIRELGALAGIAINPPTPLEKIDQVAADCDLILCMSVMPGFGGQKFDRTALDKLRTLHEREDVDALLEVDGGVNLETIADCAQAGANLLVVGSAISSGENYEKRFRQLEQLIR